MSIIYQTSFSAMGRLAAESLQDNMLITFCEAAPQAIRDYCFITRPALLTDTLRPGLLLELVNQRYPVTAVGRLAQQNLQELGHITLRFDANSQAEYPGCVHVSGPCPAVIVVGDTMKFINPQVLSEYSHQEAS
ncbi:MAG: PTS glucitol/sorbitol transporter subunit IIA [Enterobacteriaceae bacterium]